jgi:hypothetical protein
VTALLFATLFRVSTCLKRVLSWPLVDMFGRWEWQAPRWLTWSGAQFTRGRRDLIANPKRAVVLVLALASAGGALAWFVTRPKPEHVTCTVNAPGLTEYNDRQGLDRRDALVDFNGACASSSR